MLPLGMDLPWELAGCKLSKVPFCLCGATSMSLIPQNGTRFISGATWECRVGKKKWREVSGKPKGSSALCTGLQTQDTSQVGKDWTRSMWVWLPSPMSLWAAEQAFSQRFCHRWRSTPGSCRAQMRQAGFGPSWWLTDFRAAWAVWRRIGCLSNCQGCSEMQHFRAVDHQNDGAKRAGRG